MTKPSTRQRFLNHCRADGSIHKWNPTLRDNTYKVRLSEQKVLDHPRVRRHWRYITRLVEAALLDPRSGKRRHTYLFLRAARMVRDGKLPLK
jgi:hypothetical protein